MSSCFFDFVLPLGPLRVTFLHKFHLYYRSERDTANKHTTPHIQDNQFCSSRSWYSQLASCTQSWVLYFCPLPIWLKHVLRERSWRLQPPAERRPCIFYIFEPNMCSQFFKLNERRTWSKDASAAAFVVHSQKLRNFSVCRTQ